MSINEKLAVDDDPETAAFRAKCIESIKRCKDPDLLESMIVLKRMIEAKDAEITRLKEQLAQTERLVEVAEEFVKRCEAGEVRSVKTYTKFKDALAHLAGKVKG